MPRGAYKKSKVSSKMKDIGALASASDLASCAGSGPRSHQMAGCPPVSPLATAMNRREPIREETTSRAPK